MLPGPDIIIGCLKCGALGKVRSWLSGNTFGASWWTDGKLVAIMMPETPGITRCHACAGFYWVIDARQVGEIDYENLEPEQRRQIPEGWREAKKIKELSEEEFFQALAEGLGKPQKRELYLRVRTWWAGNDKFRTEDQPRPGEPVPLRSPEAAANLERLFKLLRNRNASERLMKGEVARQLGRFKEAWDIIGFAFPTEYLRVAGFLRDLIRNKDTMVRQIPQFEEK